MTGFNLPPGCNVSDLPGNGPEDAAWDDLISDIGASGLTAKEARFRWESQPELLNMAKRVLDILESCGYGGSNLGNENRHIRLLRSVIKKAEGK